MPVPASPAAFPSAPTIPLHRVRFFDHTPSPITALAFSPTPLPPATDPSAKGKAKQVDSYNGGRPEIGILVLARESGEVEIWEWVAPEDMSRGNWVLEKVLPPTLTHPGVSLMALVLRDPTEFHHKPYRVPKLADLRLYTAGSDSGDLVERCLTTGRILQTYSVPAPPIWALAVSPTHTTLAIATTSPSLHFLSLTSSGLEPPPGHMLRCDSLPSRTRTVSLAWGPPQSVQSSSGGWEWVDTYLVSGNSDSSFRKWEIPSSDPSTAGSGRVTIKGRSVVEKIKVTKRVPKGTIVWGTAVLPDHTIVTSDSLGSIIFWDGASLAQKKSFKAHKADGMVLIPGPGGRTIFTGGPDQRVCQFTLVNGNWQQTATKRLHSHDIRALAVFPAYTPAPAGTFASSSELCPVLASGGWDMGLILTPCAPPDLTSTRLRNPLGRPKGPSRTVFEEAYTRRMSYLGGGKGTGRISVSASSRLVIGRKERSVGIWRIFEEEQGWEKVLEMDLKLRTTLISSAISEDGRWLAVSDLYETKLFRLTTTPGGSMVPKRVKTLVATLTSSTSTSHLDLGNTGTGSASLLFTPDSGRLILSLAISGQILILELREADGDAEVEVVKCFSRSEGGSAARVIKPAKLGRNERRKALMAERGAMPPPEVPNGHAKVVEEKEEDEKMDGEEEVLELGKVAARVSCMAVSGDGQWLAVSDLSGKVSTFNMDTLRPHSVLPTFPHSPLSLNFPPTHPSLLMLTHPSQSLTFYQVEQRRLLPPTTQLAILNRALSDQFLPIQSSTFEPLHPGSKHSGKAAKLVIWSTDWVCTAKLDLDQIGRVNKSERSSSKALERSLRKKRAREAKQQLERTSLSASSPSLSNSTLSSTPTGAGIGSPLSRQVSNDTAHPEHVSSSDDPDFFRFTHDRFRCVAAVEWVGEGEMVVVERPMGDFVGELPAVFWTGGFGRS